MILENRARFLSACRYRSNSMATPRTKYQPMGVTWKPSSLICTRPLACRSSRAAIDRKSTRLNSSHGYISHPVFCLKKKYIVYAKLVRVEPRGGGAFSAVAPQAPPHLSALAQRQAPDRLAAPPRRLPRHTPPRPPGQ